MSCSVAPRRPRSTSSALRLGRHDRLRVSGSNGTPRRYARAVAPASLQVDRGAARPRVARDRRRIASCSRRRLPSGSAGAVASSVQPCEAAAAPRHTCAMCGPSSAWPGAPRGAGREQSDALVSRCRANRAGQCVWRAERSPRASRRPSCDGCTHRTSSPARSVQAAAPARDLGRRQRGVAVRARRRCVAGGCGACRCRARPR